MDGGKACFDDMVPDGVKVFWSFLELTGLERYEFGGGHCRLQWNHVSSFSKVKWKKGLNSMRYVICRMPKGLVSRDRCIGTGLRDMAPSTITWTTIYGGLGTRRLGTAFLCILL
jgi:hypothetical protein